MIPNILILFTFYLLIFLSVTGYGVFFGKFFNKDSTSINLGYSGIIGIFFLVTYSYLSHLFIAHGYFHNLVIIILGFVLFILNFRSFLENKYFYILILIFTILFISLILYKTHDDFPYYHFPYTWYLTQKPALIGVGQFNHGFRTPSSIFYLNSLFYLPIVQYFTFQIGAVLIMGFANLILITKIILRIKEKKTDDILYLSLLSFIFINVFFYRIQEHGTDRSAQILIFILFIELLLFINFTKEHESYIPNILIILALIISLKTFYILYLIIFFPIIFILYKENKFYLFFKTLKNKSFYLFLLLILMILIVNFFNTGCFIYPVALTCIDSVEWSIGSESVAKMNNWYEQWSKAGAGPNFRVENPELYIQNFNWLSNWIKIYFFNKVSDFILGLLLIMIILFSVFYSKKIRVVKSNNYKLLIYTVIILLFCEWFYNHPALRYGGYSIIALLVFFPFSSILEKYEISSKKIKTRFFTLMIIITLIFVSRNFIRITNEIEQYSYRPFVDSYYRIDSDHFRIEKKFNKIYNNSELCAANKKECNKESSFNIEKFLNTYIFVRNK